MKQLKSRISSRPLLSGKAMALAACLVLTGSAAIAGGAPAGFQSVDNVGGGHILSGPLPGVHSADEAVHVGLKTLNGNFGGTMNVTSALRSQDNQTMAAFFHASLNGKPVTGLSFITYSKDASREAILFDTPDRFSKSLPSMIERLKSMPLPKPAVQTASAPAAAHAPALKHVPIPPLHAHEAQDGTVGISIPSDWQVRYLLRGGLIVTGPGKQRVAMNIHMNLLDPSSSRVRTAEQTSQFTHRQFTPTDPVAPYTADIAQDFVGAFTAAAKLQNQPDPEVHIDFIKNTGDKMAFLAGTRIESGVEMRFAGTVYASPTAGGAWMLSWWMMFDTPDHFWDTAPVMLAIQGSCTYNGQRDRELKQHDTDIFVAEVQREMKVSSDQHSAYMTASDSRFRHAMAADRAAQDSIDRSAAGMIHVIQGTSVLEHTDTGAHANADANVAAAIAQQDPDHFRVVPVKDYRKGVDY